ncbi:MAG: glycosyl hydrolase 108 family protein [Bacteroidota bacterium]
MANFKSIVYKVLDVEKGYQADSGDSGNYTNSGKLVGTNYGISAKAFEQYYKREPSIQNMKNLTKNDALAIYKVDYWDRVQGDKIKNESTAHFIFDVFINAYRNGLKRVRESLQEYYQSYEQKIVDINTNSSLSDTEINLINSAKDKKLLFDMIKKREVNYRTNSGSQYAKGWVTRYNAIEYKNDYKTAKRIATGVAIAFAPAILVGAFFLGKLIYNKYIKK